MSAMLTVSESARKVLSSAIIDSSSVALSSALDRKLYLEVNKVLEAAGGKWDRKTRRHLFERDPREALGLAVETGKVVNLRQSLQAFYTPPELAAKMVALAQLEPGHLVLEPSAGMGALCSAIRNSVPAARIQCWEVDELAVRSLNDRGFYCTKGDFLTVRPMAVYDRVVMNPPFTGGQDIAHVMHALDCLKPGGRLVALTSTSWCISSTKAASAFRAFVEAQGSEVERIPAGTFAQSGTHVATTLVAFWRKS